MKVKKFKFDRTQADKKLKIEAFIDCLAERIKKATGAEDHQADDIANAYWNALDEEIEFPELADQIEFASMAMCVLLWGLSDWLCRRCLHCLRQIGRVELDQNTKSCKANIQGHGKGMA